MITDLKMQTAYPIKVNGMHICKYIADFEYKNLAGEIIVEDTKGSEASTDPLFKLKRKLVGAIYGIDVKTVIYTG